MELKPLTHFFNKKIYCVPDYQRGYSWGDKQIIDLLTDIDHSIRLDSKHYTGTITIYPLGKTEKVGLNNYILYDIVDGQQRFTTIILILSYILNQLKNNIDTSKEAEEKENTYIYSRGSYLFRYSIDNVSESYFRSLILEKESLSSLEENLYSRNLKKAKTTIEVYFEDPLNRSRLIDFLNAIEEKLLFNEYIVSNNTEIGVVFETMNNRGIGLSNLEIVKNRLLYLTSKIKTDEENKSQLTRLVKEINKKWAIILKNLTLPSRVLDEDTFLNNHWIIYKGWNKANQAKSEILDDTFSIAKMVKNPKDMIASIENYLKLLATTSLHWRFINYPEEENAFIEVKDKFIRNELKKYASKLNRLSNSTVRPLLLAFMPLMKNNPAKLLELIKLSEIFSFRIFSMNRRRSDTGKNDIYRNCRLYHKMYNNDEAQKQALWNLAWYIDVYGDETRFNLEVEELFRSNKKLGFYSWAGLSYFLYEYEDKLKGNEEGVVNFRFAANRSKSIEHILPQTFENTEWEKLIKDLSESDRKRLIHSLGNLLLISTYKNSSLKNSQFDIKKSKYFEGSYSEIEVAKSNVDWSRKSIQEREKNLISFLKKRWGIETSYKEIYDYEEDEQSIIYYEEE